VRGARRWLLLCAVGGACAPARALADEPSAAAVTPDHDPHTDEARRSALYREGIELAKAGRWTEAVERFREVVAARAAPPALYTLGQAEEHIGRLARAERHYETALAMARAAGAKDVADAAARALSAIEPRVPRVVVWAAGGIDHATAAIDGVAAPIGQAVSVDAGDRVVVVSAPGRKPREWIVRIAEGQRLEVQAALEPTSAAAQTGPASPAVESSPQRAGHGAVPIVPLALGAAGVAAVGAGLVLRLDGQSRYDVASARCVDRVCANTSDVDSGNAGRTQVIWGTIVLGAGAAALAAAAVLRFVMPRGASPEQTRVGVSVLPYRDGAGASLSARF
jgi:hypothetical protein